MHHGIWVLLAMVWAMQTRACDACGSGPASTAWGVMPNVHTHFIGLRASWRHSYTTSAMTHSFGNPGREDFLRTELIGRYAMHRRLQVIAQLPHRYTESTGASHTGRFSGPGDASIQLLGLAVLPAETARVRHALQFSGGMKFPTGRFQFSHEVPVALQNGTGTWDALAGVQYAMRVGDLGGLVEASSRLTASSVGNYRPGSQGMAMARLFYTYKPVETRWIPSVGWVYEKWTADYTDTRYDLTAPFSAGQLSALSLGADVFTPRRAAGVDVAIPLWHQMAGGYTKPGITLQARITFFFTTKQKISQS